MYSLPFADILPKSALAAVVLWGGAHYFIAGPAIAARVVKVDHLATCEADLKTKAVADAQRRAEELPVPETDPGRDMAAEQLRRLMEGPLMRELNGMGGVGDLLGLGETTDRLLGDIERGKQVAKDAYHNSLERLEADTATNLARSASVCGCLADAAIGETRTEWAIFTGTIGLVTPGPITEFGRKIADLHGAGRCTPTQEVLR